MILADPVMVAQRPARIQQRLGDGGLDRFPLFDLTALPLRRQECVVQRGAVRVGVGHVTQHEAGGAVFPQGLLQRLLRLIVHRQKLRPSGGGLDRVDEDAVIEERVPQVGEFEPLMDHRSAGPAPRLVEFARACRSANRRRWVTRSFVPSNPMRRSDPSASRRPAMPSASGEMPSPAAANFVSSLSARYAMSGRPSSRAIARRAATPSAKLENNRDSKRRTEGKGCTRGVACVIARSALSEPRTSSFRLGPCDSFGADPTSTTRAGETSRTPTTRSSMLPYRFEWEPDDRIAIHPPTVENSHDCGKWPSVRPFSFKASSSGGPRIPASTVARPHLTSIARTRRRGRRSKTIVSENSEWTSRPPTTLVPPPNGITA